MKHVLYSLFLGMSIFLFSCKNETKSKQPEIKIAPVATQLIDQGEIEEVTFKTKEASKVFHYYTALKNSLVNTDPVLAAKAASMLKDSMSVIDDHESTIAVLEEILVANDIQVQREKFVIVTVLVEKILENNVATGSFYKQYCPMAFNNTGGYWLSNSKEIRNPYFGSKMLKCGRIDKEFN
jgi:uncharacterized protein YllA (UPF0747 family)